MHSDKNVPNHPKKSGTKKAAIGMAFGVFLFGGGLFISKLAFGRDTVVSYIERETGAHFQTETFQRT